MSETTTIYEQLMESIKQKIIAGEIQVGTRLDSERKMSEKYGINRMTVRNALKHLEREGIVKSYRGKGTFVVSVPKVDKKLELGKETFYPLGMQIRQMGMKSSRILVSMLKILCEKDIKEVYPEEDEVYEIVRVSLINDRPYAIQETYIPCSMFDDIERYDFVNESLYDYMRDLKHYPTMMESTLRVDTYPSQYLDIMKAQKNKKVFVFYYTGFDENGVLVEYTKSYHDPNYTTFKFNTKMKIR